MIWAPDKPSRTFSFVSNVFLSERDGKEHGVAGWGDKHGL